MLYAFGSNGSGQLGLPDRIDRSEPDACVLPIYDESELPISIAAGGNHTLILLRSGKVLSAGSNEQGQRNKVSEAQHGFDLVRLELREAAPTVFKACSATWEASTLVTRDNALYTFGTGLKGELGQGQTITSSPACQIDFPPVDTSIVDIASCMSHTVAILSTGEVYGWGNGRKGQLGQPTGIVWSPRKIKDIPFFAIRAVCGRDFTYIVGAPETGQHLIMGPDRWNIRSSAPDHVRGWKDVRASWGTIFVLFRDGTLKSWGRGDQGQIPASDLPKLDSIAAGSEHCLALSAQGDILAWGWGEHGNCGPLVEAGGAPKHTWHKVKLNDDLQSHILGIGAGCATSWVIAYL